MTPISLEEHKKIQVEILDYFTDFCEKNNLRYFLAYGTLIGAVRHKGFIPWDDDTDVQMPIDDYKKFIELFNQQENCHYYCVAPEDRLSQHTFVKLIDTRTVKIEKHVKYKDSYLGVDIDIFPIEGQPDSDSEYEKWYAKLQKLYNLLWWLQIMDLSSMDIIRKIINYIRSKIFTKKRLLKKVDSLHKKYPYEKSKFAGSVCGTMNGKGNRCKKECFDSFVSAEFEGKQYRIPAGYDEVLKNLYGDYMQLPPVEQRITHHKNNVFRKD